MKYRQILILLFVVFSSIGLAVSGAEIKDLESASHDDEAARYIVEAVYDGEGFRITQFKLGVLSHFSYIVESQGKALVIDPGRDIDSYLAFALKKQLEWAGTFLTHSHADFVAGHREMAHATGSPIYASHLSGDLFPHLAVKEGDLIEVGVARVKVLETPGHTPDGLCALVYSQQNPEKGQFLLSGDTLFVGGVGRPDLMGGSYSAAELAGMLFDTWNRKLSLLPDQVVVLPAHGAGSLCGAHLSDEPSTTIRQEKTSNLYLKLAHDRSAFITAILRDLSDAPAYFKENAAMNRRGPKLIDWKNPLGQKVSAMNGLSLNPDVFIVDVRDSQKFAAGHIRGSINIALRGRFETWTGIIIPFNARLILRGNEIEVLEAAKRLKRVGYDADYFDFGMKFDEVTTPPVNPVDLYKKIQKGTAPVIVDVRLPNEWLGLRIGEVLNLPLNQLAKLAGKKLSPAEPVVAVCNSAFRSSLAIGILERAGFSNVSSMEGGGEAWVEAGLPVVKIDDSQKMNVGPKKEFRNLGLPEIVSAVDLLKTVKDLPGSIEIIDIRPFEQIRNYNPLNAQHTDLAELIEGQKWLVGEVPLLITDRDGTLAFMAAGIVSRKTRRPIKVLRGGIEALWLENEAGFIKDRVIEVPANEVPGQFEQSPARNESAPAVQEAVPTPVKEKRKKGAGC